jgi:hypothetical protein
VFASATRITAMTPAHAAGAVNVVVTNTDASNGTLTNGFTYNAQRFDPNGDGTVDPSDIFWLVNYLYLHGPAPTGTAGMLSGDANGDGVVDPADIFFVVNYLFDGGLTPQSVRPVSDEAPVAGSISLGVPFERDGWTIVPVIVTPAAGAAAPQSLSLRLIFDRDVRVEAVHRTLAAQPSFEISRSSSSSVAYLVSYPSSSLTGGVVAEVELSSADEDLAIAIDPALTLLSDRGTHSATVANGHLTLQHTHRRNREK